MVLPKLFCWKTIELHVRLSATIRRRRTLSTSSGGEKLRGFLAGIHAVSESGGRHAYANFDDAYSDICGVEIHLLDAMAKEMEDEMNPSRSILFGTRLVSVFDVVETKHGSQGVVVAKATRQLILNQRPNLVQTAVPIKYKRAPYDSTLGIPPPLSETHLGGLALTLPFWHSGTPSNACTQQQQQPNVVLIGAGGCSLATTLAAAGTQLVAVEPCGEVIAAAEEWFGAQENAKFRLIQALGQDYLATLPPGSIDILLIDAEDGTAPPKSMQTTEFWNELVKPKLAPGAVVGINVIGDLVQRNELRHRLDWVFGEDHVVQSISPPMEANLQGDRHALFFVCEEGNCIKSAFTKHRSSMDKLVSEVGSWMRAFERAHQEVREPVQ